MGQLKFTGGQTEKVTSAELNNLAYANKNSVLTGCEVVAQGSPAMAVDIASGDIFFGNDSVEVTAVTGLSIASNVSGFTRLDLVAINSAGTISVIQGTGAQIPTAPDYDPELYVILAYINVLNNTTSITNTHIKDIRVLNVGGAGGAGGGTFGRHVEVITAQTSVVVTHNLGDDKPKVFVYDSNNKELIPEDVTSDNANQVTVDFAIATTGKIVVYGGTGVNNAYYTETFTAQTTITSTHNLGNQFVFVQVVDGSGVDITTTATSITRTDENTVTTIFAGATTGRIIIGGGISTTDLISEEPIKEDYEILKISATTTTSNVTSTFGNVNSMLITNEGSNTIYVEFGATATTNSYPILTQKSLYLKDVNILQVAAITASSTSIVKIQMFRSDKEIGSMDTAETLKQTVNDGGTNSTLAGTDKVRYLLMCNHGTNNAYYDFAATATSDDMPIFPNGELEIVNVNVSQIASICNTAETADLRILNVYSS